LICSNLDSEVLTCSSLGWRLIGRTILSDQELNHSEEKLVEEIATISRIFWVFMKPAGGAPMNGYMNYRSTDHDTSRGIRTENHVKIGADNHPTYETIVGDVPTVARAMERYKAAPRVEIPNASDNPYAVILRERNTLGK